MKRPTTAATLQTRRGGRQGSYSNVVNSRSRTWTLEVRSRSWNHEFWEERSTPRNRTRKRMARTGLQNFTAGNAPSRRSQARTCRSQCRTCSHEDKNLSASMQRRGVRDDGRGGPNPSAKRRNEPSPVSRSKSSSRGQKPRRWRRPTTRTGDRQSRRSGTRAQAHARGGSSSSGIRRRVAVTVDGHDEN